MEALLDVESFANLLLESQEEVRRLIVNKTDVGSGEDFKSRIVDIMNDMQPSIRELLKVLFPY